MGLSLILIHYVGTQRETALTKTSDESLSEHSEMANPLYQFVFEQLSRLREYFIAARNGEDYDSDEDLDGESLVVHQGSCHCGSVAFEVCPFGGTHGSSAALSLTNLSFYFLFHRCPLLWY